MKKSIAAVIITLSLSATANAATCQVIAESIAESFVKAYNRPKTETVKVLKESCEQGVQARKNGLTAAQIAGASAATYRIAQSQLKTDEAILGFAMGNLSVTSGFAYGE